MENLEVKILNSFVNMTRNITIKIRLKFCGTSWSQALMHLRIWLATIRLKNLGGVDEGRVVLVPWATAGSTIGQQG